MVHTFMPYFAYCFQIN